MKRRDFIKNSLIVGCGLSMFPAGCYLHDKIHKNYLEKLRSNNFMYKSLDDIPNHIRIEACSLCQLKCPVCYIRTHEKEVIANGGLGFLKFSDFKKFVDEYTFIERIELSNHGEIFLNPELDKIIKYAYEKGVTLTADNGVNLNYLPDKVAEYMVKYKFKILNVAIDGATPETYKIYRVGGDFDTVINNIKKINYYKQKYNSEYPYLHWQFIIFGHNEHEIELAKVKAKELGMRINFTCNGYPKFSPVKDKEKVFERTHKHVYDGKLMETFTEHYVNEGGHLPCSRIYDEIQIDYNGNILSCFPVYDTPFRANAFKDGLLNALNSEDLVYTRRMIANMNKYPCRKDIPCAKCAIYKDLKKFNIKYKPTPFYV